MVEVRRILALCVLFIFWFVSFSYFKTLGPSISTCISTHFSISNNNTTRKHSINNNLSLYTQYCTMIEAKRQGEKYSLLRHHSAGWSSCYSDDYLVQLYVADLDIYNDKKMIFIDVGANKGYTIATWLSLWMPHLGINPRVLGDYLRTKINLNDCGACGDCREEGFLKFNSSLRINKAIEIYAFEPQPKTYEILTQIKQWMNASFMYIYQTALGNQTAIGSLQKCPPGGEVCGYISF
ncbi:unnamed protein product [Rotaria sp. Silwood1]|nr:unnamed protein product [Rotaria sp. Silwood1]